MCELDAAEALASAFVLGRLKQAWTFVRNVRVGVTARVLPGSYAGSVMIFTKELKKQVFGTSSTNHSLRNVTVVLRSSVNETPSIKSEKVPDDLAGSTEAVVKGEITAR